MLTRVKRVHAFRVATMLVIVAAGVILAVGISSASSAPPTTTGASPSSGGAKASFTAGIEKRPVVTIKETFYTANLINVDHEGGSVILAGSSDGVADTAIDDVLILKVVHPDGTSAMFKHDYSHNCQGFITPLAPQDIASKFATGLNKVTATLKDKCGGSEGARTPLWLLP